MPINYGTNDVSTSGLVTANSGNFTSSLQVNGTVVSISGHTHTASNITDFNSSVSGLLPTISNSGDNRLLTSTGSNFGINAESNLTFNGSTLNVAAGGSITTPFITLHDGNEVNVPLTIYNESSMSVDLGSSTLLFADTSMFRVYSPLFVDDVPVSMDGHTHTVNDIDDFNSSVSGLLPITNIVAGSNVNVTTSGTIYTISVDGLTTPYKNISSSATLLPPDETIFAYCDSSNITLTMPSASGVGGKKIYIKKVSGSYNLIIQPSGTQKIDNENSTTLVYINQSITLISDNSNWFLF